MTIEHLPFESHFRHAIELFCIQFCVDRKAFRFWTRKNSQVKYYALSFIRLSRIPIFFFLYVFQQFDCRSNLALLRSGYPCRNNKTTDSQINVFRRFRSYSTANRCSKEKQNDSCQNSRSNDILDKNYLWNFYSSLFLRTDKYQRNSISTWNIQSIKLKYNRPDRT